MFESPPFWMYIFGFLLLLGPLVTVHELGHYLVGRWFGVKAEAFSVGFGNELFGWTDRQGTRWRISALPLGGYVQFKGDMNPASVPDQNAPADPSIDDGSFQNAALWKRALIVAAGPVTNLIVAIAILAGFFAILGKPVYPEASTTITRFAEDSPAQAAGIKIGDRIVAIDDTPTKDFQEVVENVALYPDQVLKVDVERDGDRLSYEVRTLRVTDEDGFGNKGDRGLIGVGSDLTAADVTWESVPLLATIPMAIDRCITITQIMITGIKQVIFGQRSIKELGGPVKIGKVAGERLSLGTIPFIELIALISLNLAFINFLPIPALDGGHLAFYAAEAVRRKPVGPQATEWAYRTGIAFVLVFMVIVTWNDVTSLLPFGG